MENERQQHAPVGLGPGCQLETARPVVRVLAAAEDEVDGGGVCRRRRLPPCHGDLEVGRWLMWQITESKSRHCVPRTPA
jgi:hypothetical protein